VQPSDCVVNCGQASVRPHNRGLTADDPRFNRVRTAIDPRFNRGRPEVKPRMIPEEVGQGRHVTRSHFILVFNRCSFVIWPPSLKEFRLLLVKLSNMDAFDIQPCQAAVFAEQSAVYIHCCEVYYEVSFTVASLQCLRLNAVFLHISFIETPSVRRMCIIPRSHSIVEKLAGLNSPCILCEIQCSSKGWYTTLFKCV
jgi:hypothetical protein